MVIDKIKTAKNDNESKIEMKKSIFIAHLIRVNTEDEAKEKIEDIRKKYKDATHNVPAYRVYDSVQGQIIERCSDDGEPSGTSGKPILTLLQRKDFLNVLIVVTRYFGGTLLGTGGLVKAYTDAAIKVLEVEEVILTQMIEYNIKTSYESFNKIKKRLEDLGFMIENIVYNLDVSFKLFIKAESENTLIDISKEYEKKMIINKIKTCYK